MRGAEARSDVAIELGKAGRAQGTKFKIEFKQQALRCQGIARRRTGLANAPDWWKTRQSGALD